MLEEKFKINRYKVEDINEDLIQQMQYLLKNSRIELSQELENNKRKQIVEYIKKRRDLMMNDPGKFIRSIFDHKKKHIIDFSRLVKQTERVGELVIIKDKKEILKEVKVHYQDWTRERIKGR